MVLVQRAVARARRRVPARRLQRGPEPGPGGRRRGPRAPAHPRRAALERRHQLHAACIGRHAGAARAARDARCGVGCAAALALRGELERPARADPDDAAVPGAEAPLPGLPAAVPARRLLRALLRGRPDCGARLLQITLTSAQARARSRWRASRITPPTATSPASIRAGQKVAVCEQMEAPGQGQEAPPARGRARHHAGHAHRHRSSWTAPPTTSCSLRTRPRPRSGVALVDVSTGEFWVGEEAGRAGRRAAGAPRCCAGPPRSCSPRGADAAAATRLARLRGPASRSRAWTPGGSEPRRARDDALPRTSAWRRSTPSASAR